MASGIYRWTIDRSSEGKVPLVYIGQARDIDRRTNEHIHAIVTKDVRRSNVRLVNAVNHYGEDSITFDVLEYCTIDRLTIRELYWYNLHKKSTGFELANFIAPLQNPMDNPESREKAILAGGKNDKATKSKVCTLEKEGKYYFYNGAKSFLKRLGLYTRTRERAFQSLVNGRYKSYYGFRVVQD